MKDNSNQLTLSYELLCLLQWIVENEPDNLKKIISDALDQGLYENVKSIFNKKNAQDLDELHYSVVDFLVLIEDHLSTEMSKKTMRRTLEKQLMPAINHIDSIAYDNATVQFCIDKATLKLENNPSHNPQELLYKELLKSWKPNKKSYVNN